jgi:hypothetical protein
MEVINEIHVNDFIMLSTDSTTVSGRVSSITESGVEITTPSGKEFFNKEDIKEVH